MQSSRAQSKAKVRDANRQQKKPLKQSKKYSALPVLAKKHAKNLPSECVRNFLLARLDPFYSFSSIPCNPLNDTTPSFRYRSKFAFTLNSGNVITGNKSAWISMNWYRFMCSDMPSINYSLPASTVDSVSTFGSHGNLNNSNAMFTDSNFQTYGYGAKLVGCGIKVTNTTPYLNRSGTITLINNPANSNLSILTYAASRSRVNTKTVAFGDEEYLLLYNSARANLDDRFLSGSTWSEAVGTGTTDYWNAAIAFENIDATNFSAYIEIVGIFEYAVTQGALAAACEISPVDPDGFKVVTVAEAAGNSTFATAKEYAALAGSVLATGALGLTTSALTSYLENRILSSRGLR